MKKRIKIISLFSLIVVAVVGTICGFVSIKSKEKISDNLIVTERLSCNELSLKMTRMSNRNVNQVQITATINPSNATNKALNWELKWTDSTTKKVSDYVTLEVSTATLSATLTFIKPFDTPMELVATSVSNPEVSASCDVDCYSRSINFTEIGLSMCIDGQKNTTFR